MNYYQHDGVLFVSLHTCICVSGLFAHAHIPEKALPENSTKREKDSKYSSMPLVDFSKIPLPNQRKTLSLYRPR